MDHTEAAPCLKAVHVWMDHTESAHCLEAVQVWMDHTESAPCLEAVHVWMDHTESAPCLEAVQVWTDHTELKPNHDKTEFILNGKDCIRDFVNSSLPIILPNNVMEPAESVKSLGVTLDADDSWHN